MGGGESREATRATPSLLSGTELAALHRAFDKCAKPRMGVGKPEFQAALHLPPSLSTFSDRLFGKFSRLDSRIDGHISKRGLTAGVELCVRSSTSSQLEFFYSLYVPAGSVGPQEANKTTMKQLLTDASTLAFVNGGVYASRFSDAGDPCCDSVDSIVNAMFVRMDVLALSKCVGWLMDNTPHIVASSLEGLISRVFLEQSALADVSIMSSNWCLPSFREPDRKKSVLLDDGSLWTLSLALCTNVPQWKLLYSTSYHGRILNRFKHHTFGYDGPTVIVIRDCDDHVFGAFVEGGWRDTPKYCGTSNTFLFALRPTFSIYRVCGSTPHYVYLYSDESKKSFPHGIGFGGEIGGFRLYIDANLNNGESRHGDATFTRGPLAGESIFEVRTIEVWGIGGVRADEAQSNLRARHDKITQGRRKVNRRMMAGETLLGDDNPDKWMLDMVGITGHSNAYKDDFRKGDEGDDA